MPVKKLNINSDNENRRLDNYLMNRLKNIPKTNIYKMIRKGEIRVNSKRIKPLYKLKLGDEIRLPPFINIDSTSNPNEYYSDKFLKDFKQTKVIFGLVKIASSQVESKEEIVSRINDALKFIDKEQLIVAPDCGLGHLPRDLAKIKLKIMVEASSSF